MHPNTHCNTVYNSQNMETTSVLSTEKCIKKKGYIYTMEYYLAIKRTKECHLHKMDGPKLCRTEWSKSDRERQISYDIAYVWNLYKKRKGKNGFIYNTEVQSQV